MHSMSGDILVVLMLVAPLVAATVLDRHALARAMASFRRSLGV